MSSSFSSSSSSSSFSCSGSNVSFEFADGTVLFQGLNFSFKRRTYGLVGANGVGKTTFLKLLNGEVSPTEGVLSIQGKRAVLSQILHVPSSNAIRTTVEATAETTTDTTTDTTAETTVAEILGIQKVIQALEGLESGESSVEAIETIGDQWDLKERIRSLFQSLGIGYLSLKSPASRLSGGELVKVHLARVQLQNPDILFLDEPTNHLDSEGRRALIQFIQSQNRLKNQCIIIVSHDRTLLREVQEIVELSNQGLQFYGGHYDFYLREREKENLSLEQKLSTAEQGVQRQKVELQRNHERQQKRMAQGKRTAARGGLPKIVANGLKSKAQQSFSKGKGVQENRLAQAQLELKALRTQIKEQNRIQIDIPETVLPSKRELLELRDFNFRYSDSAEFLFSFGLSSHLIGPQRVCIKGPNGAGKSTLVKLIRGDAEAPDSELSLQGERQGSLKVKTQRIAYLDQNLEILGEGGASLLEQFSQFTPHLSESERRIRLGRFLFDQETTLKKISSLSGGERMRAALACVLFSKVPPELLILDEPTNNLDLESVERIESALSCYQGAILVISHDSEFLEQIGVSEEILIERRN